MVSHFGLIPEKCTNKNVQKNQKHNFGAIFGPFSSKLDGRKIFGNFQNLAVIKLSIHAKNQEKLMSHF